MADVFEVQDEIARAIAATLQVKLSAGGPAPRRYTPNLPAYEAYLKARHHWAKLMPDAVARSKECFEQAIALDPGFALAYVVLADYFLLLTFGLGLLPAHEAIPLVRAAAQKALDIEPSLPEAHAMLGVVAGIYHYDWREAERRFRLAMARGPVPPQVRSWYGYFYLLPTDRPLEAAEEMERGLQDDPMNLMFRGVLATSLLSAGNDEGASTELRRILELDENYWQAYLMLGLAHAGRGMLAEALAFAERGYSLSPWNALSAGLLGGLLMSIGDRSRAAQVVQSLTDRPGSYGAPVGLALFHSLCGEVDRAADWIEKGIQQRDHFVIGVARSVLRSSPRWPALAKMMNLPETASS